MSSALGLPIRSSRCGSAAPSAPLDQPVGHGLDFLVLLTLTGLPRLAIELGSVGSALRVALPYVLPRKEVIQPQLPLRLPCYDFVPITHPTFDASVPRGFGQRLQVLPASMV